MNKKTKRKFKALLTAKTRTRSAYLYIYSLISLDQKQLRVLVSTQVAKFRDRKLVLKLLKRLLLSNIEILGNMYAAKKKTKRSY